MVLKITELVLIPKGAAERGWHALLGKATCLGVASNWDRVGHHGDVRWSQAGRLEFDSLVRQTSLGREAMNMDKRGS